MVQALVQGLAQGRYPLEHNQRLEVSLEALQEPRESPLSASEEEVMGERRPYKRSGGAGSSVSSGDEAYSPSLDKHHPRSGGLGGAVVRGLVLAHGPMPGHHH